MTITRDTRIQMVPHQSSSVLGTETIVLNYDLGNYYELNELGGVIWSMIQNRPALTVGDIQAQLLDEFDVEPAVCQQELTQFLENLVDEKLIEMAAPMG